MARALHAPEPTLIEVPDLPVRAAKAAENAAVKAQRAEARRAKRSESLVGTLPEVDADWHTDETAVLPRWTPELERKFLKALYRGRGSLKYACQVCRVPFRALVERLEGEGDPRLAARVAWTQRLYRETVYEEFQDRVLTDKARPANIIFDLKSRDARYTPVEMKSQRPVNIAIALVDPTFKGAASAKPIPIEASVSP